MIDPITVPCADCGALPGKSCVDIRGCAYNVFHYERLRLSRIQEKPKSLFAQFKQSRFYALIYAIWLRPMTEEEKETMFYFQP